MLTLLVYVYKKFNWEMTPTVSPGNNVHPKQQKQTDYRNKKIPKISEIENLDFSGGRRKNSYIVHGSSAECGFEGSIQG